MKYLNDNKSARKGKGGREEFRKEGGERQDFLEWTGIEYPTWSVSNQSTLFLGHSFLTVSYV